jgi:4-phospho-D-threonate 3-dehydrogenase / 4-phospho-D-erythronate 3-dehydrogenase
MSEKPILGVTMGDPSGSGSEIIVKAWAEPAVREMANLVVLGDVDWMRISICHHRHPWRGTPD